jgi:DNA-binding MarR family transcriptional regulator
MVATRHDNALRELSSAPAGRVASVTTRTGVTIAPKYVNMADITVSALPDRGPAQPEAQPASQEPAWDIIELLFFAYRDFVGDADEVLAHYGFGRAHHRVLHFVNRHPGMKVADLLEILKITKQSLGRVLKQLIDQQFVEQKEGANDRRQRLLFATAKGQALALRLADLQTARVARALDHLGAGSHDAARRFLLAMINADSRDDVLRLMARADRIRGARK